MGVSVLSKNSSKYYSESTLSLTNPIISFDSPKTFYVGEFHNYVIVDQDTVLDYNAVNSKTGFESYVLFVGNGTNTLDLDTNFENFGLDSFDNTANLVNGIVFAKIGDRYIYNIVTKYERDLTTPTLLSAVIAIGTPNDLVLAYDEALNESGIPSTTDFVVTENSTPVSIDGVNISGSTVTLTRNSGFTPGVTVLLSYTAGASPIQDIIGNNADNLTNEIVSNQETNLQSFTLLDSIGITKSGDDYTSSTASWNSQAAMSEFLASGADGFIQVQLVEDGSSFVFGFDTSSTHVSYTSIDRGVYWASGDTNIRDITNGTLGSIRGAGVEDDIVRLDRTSGVYTIQVSTNGVDFTTIHTFAADATQKYVHVTMSNASMTVYNFVGFGMS